MSQPQTVRLRPWNDMSVSWVAAGADTAEFDFNAPLSPALDAPAYPAPPGQPSQRRESSSLPRLSNWAADSFCGVCSRVDCQLKTHRDFLATKHQTGTVSNASQVYRAMGTDYAKAGSVDDTVIRSAFTKSYAFVTPSIPLFVQPSSFRLDGFHDLPVKGGDQPEIHELIWSFLNGQLRDVLPSTLYKDAGLDTVRYAYFMAAMSDPVACFCILAVEAVSRASNTSGHEANSTTPSSSHVYQKCIEYLNQYSVSPVENSIPFGNDFDVYVG